MSVRATETENTEALQWCKSSLSVCDDYAHSLIQHRIETLLD